MSDELSEEVRFAVLRQLVENKPVSYLPLGKNIFQAPPDVVIILTPDLMNMKNKRIKKDVTDLPIEQTEANAMEEDSDESVAHVENRDRSKETIPEPENQVDLLVDDVLQIKEEIFVPNYIDNQPE